MLLVVMFMITEFGRALYQYNVLAQATREGARLAVVSGSANAKADGEARMDEFLTETGVHTDNLVRSVTIDNNFNETGRKVVKATADMPFQWILQGDLPTNPGGPAVVSPNAFTLHAETVMKAETF
jgi:Flp pilus assembly protein TadG